MFPGVKAQMDMEDLPASMNPATPELRFSPDHFPPLQPQVHQQLPPGAADVCVDTEDGGGAVASLGPDIPIGEPYPAIAGDVIGMRSWQGYKCKFRKYSRQDIMDVCERMDEITKPVTFRELEEERDLGLFCKHPCKDWAPPPTPLLQSFIPEGRTSRFSTASEGDMMLFGDGAPPRKSTQGSPWSRASRGSRSVSRDRSASNQDQQGETAGPSKWLGSSDSWQDSPAGRRRKKSWEERQ